MKKTVSIIASLLLITALLCSCSGKSSEAISMYDLSGTMMAAAPSLGEMSYVSSEDEDAENLIKHVIDTDYSKIDSFYVSYSSDGTLADEITVIAAKNKKDTAEIKSALEEHLESRKNLYKTYGPEQLKKLESAELFTSGQYAVLIVCDEASQVKKAFSDYMK